MLWILSLNVHFVIQGPSGHDFKVSIFNLDGEKASPNTLGRYTGSCLANKSAIGINSSEYTVHVINVVLGHSSRTDGGAETRIVSFTQAPWLPTLMKSNRHSGKTHPAISPTSCERNKIHHPRI